MTEPHTLAVSHSWDFPMCDEDGNVVVHRYEVDDVRGNYALIVMYPLKGRQVGKRRVRISRDAQGNEYIRANTRVFHDHFMRETNIPLPFQLNAWEGRPW